jgi:hypothetical protein
LGVAVDFLFLFFFSGGGVGAGTGLLLRLGVGVVLVADVVLAFSSVVLLLLLPSVPFVPLLCVPFALLLVLVVRSSGLDVEEDGAVLVVGVSLSSVAVVLSALWDVLAFLVRLLIFLTAKS